MSKWELKERTQASRAQTFRQFIIIGGTLGFGLAFALSGITRLSHIDISTFAADAISLKLDTLAYARFAVYSVLFVFACFCGIYGWNELAILHDWLKPEYFTIKRRIYVHLFCIFIGCLLGICFALTPDFQTLMYAFSLYTLLDLVFLKIRRDEIAKLIDDSNITLNRDFDIQSDSGQSAEVKQNIPNIFKSASDIINDYYLVRCHYKMVGVQLVGIFMLGICPTLWDMI